MVGGYALRYALDTPAVGRVTAIGRRKLGLSHPKLAEVLHRDFADCSAVAEALSGQDAAVFFAPAGRAPSRPRPLRRLARRRWRSTGHETRSGARRAPAA